MADLPLVFTALAGFIIAYGIHYIFVTARKISREQIPPGSLGWPLIGETLQFLSSQKKGSPQEFFDRRRLKYGDVFKTSLIGSPTIVLCNAQGNRFVFANESKLLAYSCPASVCKLLGKSLISCKGDRAKRIKRVLSASLKMDSVRDFVRRVDQMAKDHLYKDWIGKNEVTAYPLIKKYTFSLACSLFISVDAEEEQCELSNHFTTFLKGVLQIPLDLPGTRYYKSNRSAKAIRERIQRIIEQRRVAIENGDCEVNDVLSYLLSAEGDTEHDSSGALTKEEIRDNILFLLFAGHDSSSTTITVLLKFLAENPDCYDEIFREHMEAKKLKKPGDPLQWEDLSKMKHSWRAVQETLRLYPPAQGTFREATTDFTYEGFTIPEGWKVYWTVNSSHGREEYFTEPEKFQPSRFAGEGPSPYTFVPFGGGPRMCPGIDFAYMEILVFLHYFVQNFRWQLLDPNEKVTVDPLPVPTQGLRLKLLCHA